ncbi:MAG: protein-L-isoaspartate(D-aspartate) O-methyltransferase [Spirochaetota bacterium]
MVRDQIIARGVADPRVLNTMLDIPRHLFVPEPYRESAYEDTPLPIGFNQTISQPYIVALMTELCGLHGTERILEIGTGSGYQTAILSRLGNEVYTIERIEELSTRASTILRSSGYNNIRFRTGSGYNGWEEAAPFDIIIATASPPKIPDVLLSQLKEGGILVSPEGGGVQELVRIRKCGSEFVREHITWVRFVMMI